MWSVIIVVIEAKQWKEWRKKKAPKLNCGCHQTMTHSVVLNCSWAVAYAGSHAKVKIQRLVGLTALNGVEPVVATRHQWCRNHSKTCGIEKPNGKKKIMAKYACHMLVVHQDVDTNAMRPICRLSALVFVHIRMCERKQYCLIYIRWTTTTMTRSQCVVDVPDAPHSLAHNMRTTITAESQKKILWACIERIIAVGRRHSRDGDR